MTLKSRATEIKVETVANANTAERVGGLLEDMTQQHYIMGVVDYNHGGSTQNYTSGEMVLINDETGVNTYKGGLPEGITDIWDKTTNTFDFSNLSINDTVNIRLDVNFTTTSPNQNVDIKLVLAQDTVAEYELPFIIDKTLKTAAPHRDIRFNGLYIGNEYTRDNPAQFVFSSDDTATVSVNGFYCNIFKKSKDS